MEERIFGLAQLKDVAAVAEIYKNILKDGNCKKFTGWIEGIYPTEQTAYEAYEKNELYICKEDTKIIAAAIINSKQVDIYKFANWKYDPPENEIMVLHTLVVDPMVSSKGCGSEFVKFYEHVALKNGCRYLRMDTNEKNIPARTLYKKLGYTEVGIISGNFSGIPDVNLVCLEKKLELN